MLLSYSIPHYSCIPFCAIYLPINPTILLPCVFLYQLHGHFHTLQCIMYIIIRLLCMYMSYLMTSQQKNGGILSLLFQIKTFSISLFHITFINFNTWGDFLSISHEYLSKFLFYYWYNYLSCIPIINIINLFIRPDSHVFHWCQHHHYYYYYQCVLWLFAPGINVFIFHGGILIALIIWSKL